MGAALAALIIYGTPVTGDAQSRATSDWRRAAREALTAHVLGQREAIEACHAATVEGDEGGEKLTTHLVLYFRVGRTGASTMRIIDRTVRRRSFERCISRAIGTPRLPAPTDRDRRTYIFDLIFQSDGVRWPRPRPDGRIERRPGVVERVERSERRERR